MNKQKKVVVLGGGGFIGGHLGRRLKSEGHHVRIADIKRHEYFEHDEICHEFILGDLRDPKTVALIIEEGVTEVYQLAADMGGAGYIFTGLNDANVMHNSALINLKGLVKMKNLANAKNKFSNVYVLNATCIP